MTDAGRDMLKSTTPQVHSRYTIGEIHWFRVRDGQVIEHWHQIDGLGLMRQIGALEAHGG